MNQPKLLEVRHLQTDFVTDEGVVHAVNRISFWIKPGEILGLVGETGCGKTVTALSILKLLPPTARITDGEILFQGEDLLRLSERELRSIRGNKIAMIFQEPMTSLNPVMNVGDQVAESLVLHKKMNKRDSRMEVIRLFKAVRLPDPEGIVKRYPHQLSGGMRQRVMIAMALACHPALLVADEPTTAVDVTIQAQVLELLQELRNEYDLSILLITHALGVVAEIADRVIVMYAGKIVEEAPVQELFANACHPYTLGLLESIPRMATNGSRQQRLKTIEGSVPDLLHLTKGCSFYERCKDRMEVCRENFPEFFWLNPEHYVACHKYGNESA
jgi:oligopeptide/dipeptide ABC transporter ATP-binding protein